MAFSDPTNFFPSISTVTFPKFEGDWIDWEHSVCRFADIHEEFQDVLHCGYDDEDAYPYQCDVFVKFILMQALPPDARWIELGTEDVAELWSKIRDHVSNVALLETPRRYAQLAQYHMQENETAMSYIMTRKQQWYAYQCALRRSKGKMLLANMTMAEHRDFYVHFIRGLLKHPRKLYEKECRMM